LGKCADEFGIWWPTIKQLLGDDSPIIVWSDWIQVGELFGIQRNGLDNSINWELKCEWEMEKRRFALRINWGISV